MIEDAGDLPCPCAPTFPIARQLTNEKAILESIGSADGQQQSCWIPKAIRVDGSRAIVRGYNIYRSRQYG
jgi:hypothetical protein